MTLKELYDTHDGRESGKWEHYFEVYERYMERFKGKDVLLLELGICHGGSLQIWKKYLGSNAKIVVIDIYSRTLYEEPQIQTFCGNQSDPNFLQETLKKIGKPDIIIDDGSHMTMDVLNSFNILFPQLKNNGVYIIEDTHTSYWHNFGGGINSPLNAITVLSRYTHDVNHTHIKEPFTPYSREFKSMSFYDSMIVIEKQLNVAKQPYFSLSRNKAY